MSQWVLDQFLRASPKAIIEFTRAIAAGDHRPYLSALRMPALIVHGERDQVSPLEAGGRALAQAIAGSRLSVYEGAPHGVVVTHRDRFTQDLLSFMQS